MTAYLILSPSSAIVPSLPATGVSALISAGTLIHFKSGIDFRLLFPNTQVMTTSGIGAGWLTGTLAQAYAIKWPEDGKKYINLPSISSKNDMDLRFKEQVDVLVRAIIRGGGLNSSLGADILEEIQQQFKKELEADAG